MFKLILLFFLISSNINCADISGAELLVDNITNIKNATDVRKHPEGKNVQYSGILPNGQVITAYRADHANFSMYGYVYRCILEKSGKIVEVSKNPAQDFDVLEKIFKDASEFPGFASKR